MATRSNSCLVIVPSLLFKNQCGPPAPSISRFPRDEKPEHLHRPETEPHVCETAAQFDQATINASNAVAPCPLACTISGLRSISLSSGTAYIRRPRATPTCHTPPC